MEIAKLTQSAQQAAGGQGARCKHQRGELPLYCGTSSGKNQLQFCFRKSIWKHTCIRHATPLDVR